MIDTFLDNICYNLVTALRCDLQVSFGGWPKVQAYRMLAEVIIHDHNGK